MSFTSKQKLYSRAALSRLLANARRRGRRIVFTNGVFDVLHAGHVKVLERSRALGDLLVVGLNSDRSVRRLKGPKRPVNSERDRAAVLAGLEAVDYISIFAEDTPYELLKALRPTILVKGGDYAPAQIVGRDLVKKVVRVPLVKGRSTTNVIKKIVDAYKS